jgi:hypothetical protein
MYKDNRKKLYTILILTVLICTGLFLGYRSFSRRADADLSDEAVTSIKEAIRSAALQCYALEGSYPSSLDYLKDHYGLNINEEDYYVVYNAFAQNQLPEIRVVRKEK